MKNQLQEKDVTIEKQNTIIETQNQLIAILKK